MALIPVGLGIAFLCLAPGVKTYNKAIAHIVVFLALMTLAALVPPLLRVMGAGNTMAIARILGMLLTTGIALGFYVKSFIDARRSRPKTESEDTEINEEV
jgi:small neutral amino acid transporter SnatA (MarC family)